MSIDKISIDEISILQLCDSFFPTGMYTTSNGLEAIFYSDRKINDAKAYVILSKYMLNTK